MSTTVAGDVDELIHVCCVFLCRDASGRLLLHRRSEACRDEAGTWDCGGGELEFGEDPFEAVRREVCEEYGAPLEQIRAVGTRNVLREHGGSITHWVALVFEVIVDPSAVRIAEPEKMEGLGWFELDSLPSPLHSQLREHLLLLPAEPKRVVSGQPLLRLGMRVADQVLGMSIFKALERALRGWVESRAQLL